MIYCFLRFPNFKYKALTLSYDDSVIYNKKLAEILDAYGIKATFNLNYGVFGNNERNMTKEEAYDLFKNSPHEVALHGYKHILMPEYSKENCIYEITKDREGLEGMFSRLIKGMAYAYGEYDDKVIDVLKNCGVNYARTLKSTHSFNLPENWLTLNPTCHHADKDLMNLANEFLSLEKETRIWSRSPKMFYLWGHSYEFNDNNNWDLIEDFCKLVSGKDDIWYATNGEIYDYVNAYNRLEYSMDSSLVYNPTLIDVYIEFCGKEYVIKSGETVKLN